MNVTFTAVRYSDNKAAALTAVGGFAVAVAGSVIAGPVGAVLVVGGTATFLAGWAVNVCHAKAAQLQGQWSTDGFVEVEHYTTNACASVYPAKHCTDEYNGLRIRNLMNDVASIVPAKWRAIGIQLELPSGTLDSIQQEHARKPQADQHSFETMLNIWKQLAKTPYTWKTIIDALKAPSVGENQLGDDLEAKYIRTERLGLSQNDKTIFQSSSAVYSHTHDQEIWASMNPTIKLMDTPGLMDTGGVVRDEDNIAKIVQHVSTLGYVNGFILVVNEQAPRFDGGMQDAVKLLVDSFGPLCLRNFAIVYNRAFGIVSPSESAKRTAEYTEMIMNRTAIPINHLPSWQNPVDTTGAVIGEYEQRRKAREEEEKRKEADARRIYDQSVILTETETTTKEYKRSSEPIMHAVERSMNTRRGGFAGLIGRTRTVRWTEHVHVGNRVTFHMRESQRIVNTLGSGQKVYGEWTTVREWNDVVN
eukprot:Em0002g1366a